jgi:hypothetical protein
MIRCLIAAALAMPIAAHAEASADQQRLHECGMKGLAFQMAATFRDSGFSPQYSADYLRRAKYDGTDDAFIKKAVNLVYFDDHFTDARGPVLAQQITQACFRPNHWKPVE